MNSEHGSSKQMLNSCQATSIWCLVHDFDERDNDPKLQTNPKPQKNIAISKKMELENRPHHAASINGGNRNNATSDLSIFFTSRLSSSSSTKMPSSKSMPSPGRPRVAVPQISLPSSLSGRPRNKGGQASPMFPPGGKKRGCTFEDPEPSSPKVTCIGHVRVKAKKQVKKPVANHPGGEVSFRRVEVGMSGLQRSGRQDSNLMSSQKKMSSSDGEETCSGFRMFGAEWNCFQPCRSSCSTRGEEKGRAEGESKEETHGGGSCGAVIARWLVALHEGPEGKGGGRKIELVVGDEEHLDEGSRSYRRHFFEGIEFDEKGIRGFEGEEEEEGGRVSVCIPPKNALLLMRCRSDPVKVAALVSKFCDGPVQPADLGDDREVVLGNVCGNRDLDAILGCREEGEAGKQSMEFNGEGGGEEGEAIQGEEQRASMEEEDAEVNLLANELSQLISSNIKEEIAMDKAMAETGVSSFERLDREKLNLEGRDDAGDGSEERSCVLSMHFLPESEDSKEHRELTEAEAEVLCTSEEKGTSSSKEAMGSEVKREEAPKLPDCLLLMMREPKLSMEVSRETWVCSNDFLRWLPERPVPGRIPTKVDTRDHSKKRTSPKKCSAILTDDQQERILQQPPRNSCSFPGKASDHGTAESTVALIEQKLGSAKAHEPFILTRCKSEPMRRAATTKLPQDASCFRKNNHGRPVNNLVKAAGFGF